MVGQLLVEVGHAFLTGGHPDRSGQVVVGLLGADDQVLDLLCDDVHAVFHFRAVVGLGRRNVGQLTGFGVDGDAPAIGHVLDVVPVALDVAYLGLGGAGGAPDRLAFPAWLMRSSCIRPVASSAASWLSPSHGVPATTSPTAWRCCGRRWRGRWRPERRCGSRWDPSGPDRPASTSSGTLDGEFARVATHKPTGDPQRTLAPIWRPERCSRRGVDHLAGRFSDTRVREF
jgi:hypothetical protein